MLLYSGVRISEMLDLKKENVHLYEQYFDVICSKTENGIRKVPIADKVLSYYKAWYESCPECEYLLHTEDGKHFEYRNYYDSYFKPFMEQLGINRTPPCCRHTCISMLAEAGINQTIIKKIVGHSGAMTLTKKVYTHFDIKELVDAINKIQKTIDAIRRLQNNLAHDMQKRTFPDSSENVLYISISLLHTCCICVAFDVNSSTSDSIPQLL